MCDKLHVNTPSVVETHQHFSGRAIAHEPFQSRLVASQISEFSEDQFDFGDPQLVNPDVTRKHLPMVSPPIYWVHAWGELGPHRTAVLLSCAAWPNT